MENKNNYKIINDIFDNKEVCSWLDENIEPNIWDMPMYMHSNENGTEHYFKCKMSRQYKILKLSL